MAFSKKDILILLFVLIACCIISVINKPNNQAVQTNNSAVKNNPNNQSLSIDKAIIKKYNSADNSIDNSKSSETEINEINNKNSENLVLIDDSPAASSDSSNILPSKVTGLTVKDVLAEVEKIASDIKNKLKNSVKKDCSSCNKPANQDTAENISETPTLQEKSSNTCASILKSPAIGVCNCYSLGCIIIGPLGPIITCANPCCCVCCPVCCF